MEDQGVAVVLAALYLRGLARPGPAMVRRWPQVDHALRVARFGLSQGAEEASQVLSRAGMWYEGSLLQEVRLWEAARALVEAGRALTAAHAGYPAPWRGLGGSAPPALWRKGSEPLVSWRESRTIVGSRAISSDAQAIAEEAGRAACEAGLAVVSGGAQGADHAAAAGALQWAARVGCPAPLIEILPHGIAWPSRSAARSAEGEVWAVAAPSEGFSAALAMERNALLYAASPRSIVIAPRLREGGSWHGAVDALRRRLGEVWVWQDGSPGVRGLEALGAFSTGSIDTFISGEAPQRALFG